MENIVAAQLAQLQDQVRAMSDRLEIYAIVADYAPATDSRSDERLVSGFAGDGILDTGGAVFNGRGEIGGFVRGETQPEATRQMLAKGGGHVMSMPIVSITGDTAVATFTSQFYKNDETGFTFMRLSAIRMELARSKDGWQITRRTSRALDGSDAGKAIYRSAWGS